MCYAKPCSKSVPTYLVKHKKYFFLFAKKSLHSRAPVLFFSHARPLRHPNPKRRVCFRVGSDPAVRRLRRRVQRLSRRDGKKVLARGRKSWKLILCKHQNQSTAMSPLAAEQNTTSTQATSASTTKPSWADARGASNTQSLFPRRNGLKSCEPAKRLASLLSTRSCRIARTTIKTCGKSLDTHTLNL